MSATLSYLKADRRNNYGKQACNDKRLIDDNFLRVGADIYYHNGNRGHAHYGRVKNIYCEGAGMETQSDIELIMGDGCRHIVPFNLFSNHFANHILTPFVFLKEYLGWKL